MPDAQLAHGRARCRRAEVLVDLQEGALDERELGDVGHDRSCYPHGGPPMQEHIDTFEEFWPHYVHAHRNPINRMCHYVGTTAAIGSVATAAMTFNPLWLLAAPVAGYGPAWFGHFVFEKNRPATFRNPIRSLRGDFKMYLLALRGKMADEVERICGGDMPLDHTHEDHLGHASNGTTATAAA